MTTEAVKTAPDAPANTYYADKIDTLRDLFPTDDVRLDGQNLVVGDKTYPIIDDVIVVLEPEQYPDKVRRELDRRDGVIGRRDLKDGKPFAEDIQYTFGAEWTRFNEVVPEYDNVFNDYFDLTPMDTLAGKRVIDVGCGTGRWAKMVNERAKLKEIVCFDFSEAIFVARNNLREHKNAIFFMGDLQRMPFRDDAFDFLYTLGVLLTLPTDQLDEVRRMKRLAPELLVYTYYSLDNRPWFWRVIFWVVNAIRLAVYRVRSPLFREVFTFLVAVFAYAPMLALGTLLKPFGLERHVPLYEDASRMNFRWWRLLAYDRFFCGIEQRVSRAEIMELKDTFSEVIVSPNLGYWHFLCKR